MRLAVPGSGRRHRSQQAATVRSRRLREVIGTDRLVKWIHVARYNGDAGPSLGRTDALGADECAQDRPRQIGVMGFDRSIQPTLQFPLAPPAPIPIAILLNVGAGLPQP